MLLAFPKDDAEGQKLIGIAVFIGDMVGDVCLSIRNETKVVRPDSSINDISLNIYSSYVLFVDRGKYRSRHN